MVKEISRQKARSMVNVAGWAGLRAGYNLNVYDGERKVMVWAKNAPDNLQYKSNMKTIYYMRAL